MNNNILSLLGLALRGGRLVVGEEPTALAARAGQARLLLAASDAADNTLRRAEHLAGQGHCLWLVLPFSKAELGGALGRGSAALTALTDTGLAAALTERLAALDPERYGEIAQRMDLKLRRAKERRAAPHRDPPPAEERRPRGPRRDAGGAPSRRDGPGGRDARPRSGRRGGPHGAKHGSGGRPSGGRASQQGAPGKGRERPGENRFDHGRRRPDGGGPNRSHRGKPGGGRPAGERSGGGGFRGGKRPEPGKGRPPKGGGGR